MRTTFNQYQQGYRGFSNIARVFGFIVFSFILNLDLNAQEYKFLEVSERFELSRELTEISGITYVDNIIYAINDSGNSREVHILDNEDFEIVSSIRIKGSSNIDWEELSSFNNTLYVGDFGNNFGNRKDLIIYKISVDSLLDSEDGAERIKFQYLSQDTYNLIEYKQHIFDCEAMIVNQHGIWIFSKDWIDRTTRLYRLSDDGGDNQILRPLDSLKLGYLVTGAYFDNASERVFLCGYEGKDTFVTIFPGADDVSLSGEYTIYTVPEIEYGQVESIFVKDNVVYLASERASNRQSIYKIFVPEILE